MTDRAEFANAQAKEFNARTLAAIALVLDRHSASVVEFAVAMQQQLDDAEQLLSEFASCIHFDSHSKDGGLFAVIRPELMARIKLAVANSKARTP